MRAPNISIHDLEKAGMARIAINFFVGCLPERLDSVHVTLAPAGSSVINIVSGRGVFRMTNVGSYFWHAGTAPP